MLKIKILLQALKKVFIGHKDPNHEAAGGLSLLEESGCEVAMQEDCAARAKDLLQPFITWQKNLQAGREKAF
jgi:pyrimidine deaminase RibD-like protein